jgi:hypothetical protein
VKGVLTGPASRIKNLAGECAFVGQTQDRRLWPSDVPGRGAIEVRRIPGLTGMPLVTGWSAPAVRIVGLDPAWLGDLPTSLRLVSRASSSQPAVIRTRQRPRRAAAVFPGSRPRQR